MGQSCPIVVACGSQENLRLMLQSPKGLGVDDPVPVMLKGWPKRTFLLNPLTPPGPGTQSGKGGEGQVLLLFQFLPDCPFHHLSPQEFSIDKALPDRLCS
jgi:hypothetical protein